MERQSRLVHPHACVPPVALLTMGQSRSKTAGHSAFYLATNTIDVETAIRQSNRVRNSHFGLSAELTASSRAVSLNGLNRHSTAPWSSSRVRTVLSVLAVMKMIGISRLRRDSSR